MPAETTTSDPAAPDAGTRETPRRWQLVPVEPTAEMKRAAFGPILHGGRGGPLTSDFIRQEAALSFWPMMLRAAPKPPASTSMDDYAAGIEVAISIVEREMIGVGFFTDAYLRRVRILKALQGALARATAPTPSDAGRDHGERA